MVSIAWRKATVACSTEHQKRRLPFSWVICKTATTSFTFLSMHLGKLYFTPPVNKSFLNAEKKEREKFP
jgi:hypothetical protein